MIDLIKLHHLAANWYSLLPRYIGNNGFAFPPLKATFTLTHKCNQKCEMCYIGHQEKGAQEQVHRDYELTAKEFSLIIRQIPRYCLISFTGGEPFLRGDFIDIFKEACKHHKVLLITNGTLMNEEVIKNLIKASLRNILGHGLFSLNISILGMKEEHDVVTQTKGSFEKVCENVRMFQYYKKREKSEFPLVDFKAVILRENVQCLSKIFKLAETLEFNSCTFGLFRYQFSPNCTYVKKNNERISDYNSINRIEFPRVDILSGELEKVRQLSIGSRVKLRFSPDISISEIIKHYSNKQDVSEYICYLPWMAFYVDPRGDVLPCFYYKVGNLRKEPFKKIWNGLEMKGFREELKRKGIFPACAGCCFAIHKRNDTTNDTQIIN